MTLQGIRPALLLALVNLLTVTAVGAADTVLAQAGDKPRLIDLWQPGDPGHRMNIRGTVTTIDGTPVVGAYIYIRQADGTGAYTENYSTTIESDAKGRYQFGSVLPGQYYGTKHVHIWAAHDSHGSVTTEILFQGDPNLEDPDAPNAIFLEEATVNGETILFGRFDITLPSQ